MAVSVAGQGVSAAAVRHVAATVAVSTALFGFLYGPPLTELLTDSAHRQCNRVSDASFRNYRLEWQTTTLTSVSNPHWVCFDLTRPERPGRSLGWWTGV